MSYGQFLLLFLLVPIVGLAGLLVRDWRAKPAGQSGERGWSPLAVLAGLTLIALVYTFPWDNHLIAQGVWRYDPARLSGVRLDWIPLEEVLFFPLQTILIWLWVQWLIPRVVRQGPDAGVGVGDTARWISVASGSILWLASLLILRSGWQPGTYLSWELVWALPPLILQFGVGGDLLWQGRRLLLAALVPVVVYLSAADALAIHQGIWTISPQRSLGLLLGGVLPLEELVFFLLTSSLVACGLILAGTPEVRARLTGRMASALHLGRL